MDALRAGNHPFADRGRIQLSPGAESDAGRSDADVAPPGPGSGAVVRGDPGTSPGLGGLARGRNRLAGQWQDPLAVVFRHRDLELFYDRSIAGQSGAVENVHPGIRRRLGERFLGPVQRLGVRLAPEVRSEEHTSELQSQSNL